MWALLPAFLLGFAAVLHFYWAAGGMWGLGWAIPARLEAESGQETPLFAPGALGVASVAFGLLGLCLLVLDRSGMVALGLPKTLRAWALGAAALLFGLRALGDFHWVGVFKRVRGTQFARADDWLFIPLFVLLSLSLIALLLV